jgi:hypothetical protein
MKFYTFHQSNPGGYLIKDDKLDEYVIIQAKNADEANSIAQKIGIYFNGVRKKLDCSCCNDRWWPVSEKDGCDSPNVYGDSLSGFSNYKYYGDEEWLI